MASISDDTNTSSAKMCQVHDQLQDNKLFICEDYIYSVLSHILSHEMLA